MSAGSKETAQAVLSIKGIIQEDSHWGSGLLFFSFEINSLEMVENDF